MPAFHQTWESLSIVKLILANGALGQMIELQFEKECFTFEHLRELGDELG
jgi:hypothetical protein